ncbi:hypothetical protein LguiA_007611 [Lonicera macranthoides]
MMIPATEWYRRRGSSSSEFCRIQGLCDWLFLLFSRPVSGILFHTQTSTINDVYKRLQEYKTSVQPYNGKLQLELATANETRKHVESILRGHYTSLQDQLTSLLLE